MDINPLHGLNFILVEVNGVIHGDKTKQTTHQDTSTAQSTQDFLISNEVEEIDDNWEIATDEDIESGNFEVAA